MIRFGVKLFASAVLMLAAALGSVAAEAPILRMATTTSPDNTGLLDYLKPILMEDTGIDIRWVSVGTGKALEYGRNGDVDVVLTHDPKQEEEFILGGYGIAPRKVMYNDFVLLGPASDPAGVKGMPIIDAIRAIAGDGHQLISRADKSGTHMAELRLLKAASIENPDRAEWYIQTGRGMLDTINMAGERHGYTLSDRGTFIKYEIDHGVAPPLVIVVEGDDSLKNQYTVTLVNPAKHPNAKYDLASRFAEWITGPKIQQKIADFRLKERQLFFPNADRQD